MCRRTSVCSSNLYDSNVYSLSRWKRLWPADLDLHWIQTCNGLVFLQQRSFTLLWRISKYLHWEWWKHRRCNYRRWRYLWHSLKRVYFIFISCTTYINEISWHWSSGPEFRLNSAENEICSAFKRKKNRYKQFKLISHKAELSMKLFLLINIKMPTIVGILIFIGRKNFMLHWIEHEKKSYNIGPWSY